MAWKPLQGNLYGVDIFSQSNSLLYLMERSEKRRFLDRDKGRFL